MADLHVFGTVGKSTARIMAEAALGSVAADLPVPVVVLLSPGVDSAGRPWQNAVASLDAGARVVVNADSLPAPETTASVVTFGLTDAADIRASDVDASLDGTTFTLTIGSAQQRVRLNLLGEHQVTNALAAIGVALSVGIPVSDAVSAVEGLDGLGRGRMERLDLPDGPVLINDAVSATPESAAAALKALAQVAAERRSVAVLGELSVDDDESRDAHDRIGRLIVRLNIKKLVVVGQRARHIHNAAGLEGSWDGESVLLDTPAEAYDFLREEIRPRDIVLVKSSEAAGLGMLADRLAGVIR